MALSSDPVAGALQPRVLCVDDDRNIGATVQAILGDEGYDVTCLFEITDEALRRVIGEVEPDCILLDSASRTNYSRSWEAAAWIRHRTRAVPVVMFSAHLADNREALENLTERAQEAGFAAVLPKPFSIDQLLAAVSTAVARSRPLDPVDADAHPIEAIGGAVLSSLPTR
jgi:CheY-like chemotaxis protein